MRYREQYDRMKRWYERFRAVDREGPLGRSVEHQRDDLLAFFVFCFHMRDWIWYDQDVPQPVRDAARKYVEDNPALARCYHLAVGAKHLIVKYPIGDKKASIETRQAIVVTHSEGLDHEEDGLLLPPGIPIHTVTERFHVETDAGTEDAFAFATKCVEAWDEFFKAHGL